MKLLDLPQTLCSLEAFFVASSITSVIATPIRVNNQETLGLTPRAEAQNGRIILWDYRNTNDYPSYPGLQQSAASLASSPVIKSIVNWETWRPAELPANLDYEPMVRTPAQLTGGDWRLLRLLLWRDQTEWDTLYATTVLIPFPMFHMGAMGPAIGSISCDNTIVIPFPGTPLAPANITAILKIANYDAPFLLPSVLESLLAHTPAYKTLPKLSYVDYMGGPINPARGAELAKLCKHLYPIVRSTECASGQLESSKDSSHFDTVRFVEFGQQYRTSNLFAPTDDGWWVYRGRTDNWVVMSNGLKMDPTEMENQVAVADKGRAYDEIWQLVKQANKNAPKFGQIARELILIAKPEKPSLRASKGTIQRRLTINHYEPEINELYENAEKGLLANGFAPIASTRAGDLGPFLVDLHTQTLDIPEGHTISVDDDLLSLGLDSLVSFLLLARLKAALRQHVVVDDRLEKITPKLWYSAPTIRQMAGSLSTTIWTPTDQVKNASKDTDHVNIEELLAKYTEKVQALNGTPRSYILSTELADTSSNVICLNRSSVSTARAKYVASLQRIDGLTPEAATSLATKLEKQVRVRFLQGKLPESHLGLSDEAYAWLSSQTTSIIHNAFAVNFLLGLPSFEPAIQGLVNILDLASRAATLSSGPTNVTIPEAVITPEQVGYLLPMGYAQAKYICKSLLHTFANSSPPYPPVSVLRLAISSKFLGAVPASLGKLRINWIPVDQLAKIAHELTDAAKTNANKFMLYNVVNP
ncbi:hypothetical protein F4778DRAFT_795880 [Xylariomycetidae sp. FL2044]|nr:hypothetical protein F4778DRAFT_795880 [Xylariomycetidae sp. FL2044]